MIILKQKRYVGKIEEATCGIEYYKDIVVQVGACTSPSDFSTKLPQLLPKFVRQNLLYSRVYTVCDLENFLWN